MAKFSFSDIEDAFEFVNCGGFSEKSALLCKNTGKILYESEGADLDEIGDESIDHEKCVYIPDKNDLELGRNLVFEFVEKKLPGDYEQMEQFFRHRGAYSSYKAFLEKKGLLQEWYDFENQSKRNAILEWCKDNGVELEE